MAAVTLVTVCSAWAVTTVLVTLSVASGLASLNSPNGGARGGRNPLEYNSLNFGTISPVVRCFLRVLCNYSSSGVVLHCGGNYNNRNANYGLFYLNGNNAVSNANANIGCRRLVQYTFHIIRIITVYIYVTVIAHLSVKICNKGMV